MINEYTPLPKATLDAFIDGGWGLRSLDNDYVHTLSRTGRGSVIISSTWGLYLEVDPKDFYYKENVLRVASFRETYDFEITKTITVTINNISDELIQNPIQITV